MEYGICTLPIIPMRAAPSEKSEMVSQLLFGEIYQLIPHTEGEQKNWVYVSALHDGYEGWISRNQVTLADTVAYDSYQNSNVLTTKPVSALVKQSDGSLIYIPFGSSLSGLNENKLALATEQYDVSNVDANKGDVLSLAQTFLNTPYLWGGRTHFGIDCSGLVQAVFRQQGINLKRDAYLQAEEGSTVDFLAEVKPGDVAFFDNDEGRITHVGILMSQDKIIHSSGRVKIEHIDTQGIYSEEFKKYTHKLRIIKRFA
ncbi:C40 family peptidase [Mucilaginibacter ginkgonis]|uniref:C40 family peptidase n=1 Tax=Mucilaginibacter ginkgonis TaxID=2682091 RepID=A0A6I4IN23_9SPHI|nr:C40 family peptidase [Mucilaginibacter ginkgonis]QQL51026.1 C40 family peptidase [Mucilaginibacter ginkgonis]